LKEAGEEYRIDLDVIELAGLAHDLGHPPFGHFGEKVLDQKMKGCGGFEGNAQTLRVLSKTEKGYLIDNTTLGIDKDGKDLRVGLNLTARSLASVLKYDREIQRERSESDKLIKGYYGSEKSVVEFVKDKVLRNKTYSGKFETIECQIMDIADDISYSTYDLEDCFKAGFIKPIDLFCADDEVIETVRDKVNDKLSKDLSAKDVRKHVNSVLLFNLFDELKVEFENWPVKLKKDELDDLLDFYHKATIFTSNNLSNMIAEDGYNRTRFSSRLVGRAIRSIKVGEINKQVPALSRIRIEDKIQVYIEILKNIVYETQILAPRTRIAAYRSKEIINAIFKALDNEKEEGFMLLPEDFRVIYKSLDKPEDKRRLICDFIAGMTDRYALEFYGRLTSENPETIFKPL